MLELLDNELFPRLLTASGQAAAMAAVVWLVTLLAGRWISARWRCALWSLVFIRLLMPALPPSPLSLLNLKPTAAVIVRPMVADQSIVTFGVVPEAAAGKVVESRSLTAEPPV